MRDTGHFSTGDEPQHPEVLPPKPENLLRITVKEGEAGHNTPRLSEEELHHRFYLTGSEPRSSLTQEGLQGFVTDTGQRVKQEAWQERAPEKIQWLEKHPEEPYPLATATSPEIYRRHCLDSLERIAGEEGARQTRVIEGGFDPSYNCFSHALTDGKGGWIRESREIQRILDDNGFYAVEPEQARAEDVIVFRDGRKSGDVQAEGDAGKGELVHMGVVSRVTSKGIDVLNKWGEGGLYEQPVEVVEGYAKFYAKNPEDANWEILRTDRTDGRLMTPASA